MIEHERSPHFLNTTLKNRDFVETERGTVEILFVLFKNEIFGHKRVLVERNSLDLELQVFLVFFAIVINFLFQSKLETFMFKVVRNSEGVFKALNLETFVWLACDVNGQITTTQVVLH